jgi:hypothetical protein
MTSVVTSRYLNGPTTLVDTVSFAKLQRPNRSQTPIQKLRQLQRKQTPPILQLRLNPKLPLPFSNKHPQNPHVKQNIISSFSAQILNMPALCIANSEVRIVIVSHRLQGNSVSLWLVALAIRILRRQADLQHCFGQIGVGDSSTGFGPEAASQPDEEDLVAMKVVSR